MYEFRSSVSTVQGNAFQKDNFDLGHMYIVGRGRRGDSSIVTYQMTEYEGVECALTKLAYVVLSRVRTLTELFICKKLSHTKSYKVDKNY